MSFQRVGAAEAAAGQFEFKVSLVSPGQHGDLLPRRRHRRLHVLPLRRPRRHQPGPLGHRRPDYEGDVATYRLYVVNHEVGHVLGNGHEPARAPASGAGHAAADPGPRRLRQERLALSLNLSAPADTAATSRTPLR